MTNRFRHKRKLSSLLNEFLTISNNVVEFHRPLVDIPDFSHHSVQVHCLYEHPGEGTHEEIVEEYCDQFACELK